MNALASPVRHQIHLAMEMLGVCSIKELAEHLRREPATLYYHMNMLERIGILKIVGQRSTGVREESLYRLNGDRVCVDLTQRSPRFLNAFARGCGALLRYAQRSFVAAIKDDANVSKGVSKNFRLRQVNIRLSKKSLREVNTRLDELQEFINQADSTDGKHELVITICVAPIKKNSD